jgi:hypothetical protein
MSKIPGCSHVPVVIMISGTSMTSDTNSIKTKFPVGFDTLKVNDTI